MSWLVRSGYVLAGLLALAPIGYRLLHRPVAPKLQALDATAAREGLVLFKHEWTPNDPLAKGGDGLGPVFNAKSCVACHHLGGVGGSGGLEHNVTTFTIRSENPEVKPREGVVHAFAVKYRETLAQVHQALPPLSQPPLSLLVPASNSNCGPTRTLVPPRGVHLSQRNTPALFGAKLIDELPDRVLIANERSQRLHAGLASSETEDAPVGRASRLADGRVGKFGWKGQSASLADFVQAACANELGLGNPGQAQPRPLGKPDYQAPGLDLTLEQCQQLTTFIASLSRPVERLTEGVHTQELARAGKKVFHTIGCADCHTPSVASIEGIYSDLLLHRMGQPLEGGGSYNEPPLEVPAFKSGEGPLADEWRTPPLWGVADSAPYLHDGRAATLEVAIRLHGGQGARSAQRFAKANRTEQAELIAFLQTLRAP